ncbi:YicC/YloC family endoribonuclease [Clostridium kluyveri]|uniref:YicC family protein n=1 Tax=Clostridium kluyveri TaxID=1534 RepID=A0A1L5F6X9_CLOKL|nr:YicC/YloC family endoribonuclease [Clostridium kluyveri]APM38732.1 YicC family protein [Clostridium kluyveri]UZQ51049.1 YicC family protein [Clostridium kluyveri]
MIRSMTGFGRGTLEDENQSFIVEMKSVNHRYCDLNVKMPKSLMLLEDKMRKVILQRINRGKVDIIVTQRSSSNYGTKAVLDEGLADSYVECFNRIKEKYDIKENIPLSLVAKFPEVITLKKEEEDVEHIWKYLSQALNDALSMLVDMREKEGEKLEKDLSKKCNYILSLLIEVGNNSQEVVKDYRNKLSQRLRNLLEEYPVDESRIEMEVALFADKSSIDEEIVRLNSHIVQFQKTLTVDEPVGRKLDFILQEMNREANTIASKSTNLNITKSILEIKNEIEKIREQIQNVE